MADFTDLSAATSAVTDLTTPAGDLAAIAAAQPSLGAQVAAHPNVYPGLLDWLGQYGTQEAKAAVAARVGGGRSAQVELPEPPAPGPVESAVEGRTVSAASVRAALAAEAAGPSRAARAEAEPAGGGQAALGVADAAAPDGSAVSGAAGVGGSVASGDSLIPPVSSAPVDAGGMAPAASPASAPYAAAGMPSSVPPMPSSVPPMPSGQSMSSPMLLADAGIAPGGPGQMYADASGQPQGLRMPVGSKAPVVAGILFGVLAVLNLLGLLASDVRFSFFFSGWPYYDLWTYDVPLIVFGLVACAALVFGCVTCLTSKCLAGATASVWVGVCVIVCPALPVLSFAWQMALSPGFIRYNLAYSSGWGWLIAKDVVMLVAGVVFLLLIRGKVAIERQSTLRTVVLAATVVAFVLEIVFVGLVWWAPGHGGELEGWLFPSLLPFAIFLVAIAMLAMGLSADPSKVYLAQPSARALPAPVPQQVMVTMPDGTQQLAMVNQPVGYQSAAPDARSFGFAVLGFFFPYVGLILWLVWKDQTPLKAKSAGTGALVSAIIGAVVMIIYFIVIGALIASLR